MEELAKPLTLKSGLTLSNRLVKAAMAERMADARGLPHRPFYRAYSKWAEGGWGMILTGNVFVDPAFLGMRSEVSIPATIDFDVRAALSLWSESCSSSGTPAIVQLNHAGRQSGLFAGNRSVFTKTIAPSAVPLNLGPGIISRAARVILFGTPREMNIADIERVIDQFVHCAKTVADAGFAGVELHAAHGYLLSQFMGKKTNLRQDAWGGDATRRVQIVVEIIRRVRAATSKSFVIGVKLNSADHQNNQAMEEALTQIRAIVDAGIDFLEISGGTWEDPQMTRPTVSPTSTETQTREAFFLSFAKAIRTHFPGVPLMVTGGFRSRKVMASAIRDGACDLIGMARPAVLNPALPKNKIFDSTVDDGEKLHTEQLKKPWLEWITGNRVVGAGAETTWYTKQIQSLAGY